MGGVELFGTERSQQAFAKAIPKISSSKVTNDFEEKRNAYIVLILEAMKSMPDTWDGNCQVNIEWIGLNFVNNLFDEGLAKDKGRLDSLFVYCFRFLLEFYLSTTAEFNPEFDAARQFASSRVNEFEGSARENIEWTLKQLPIALVKRLINGAQVSTIKEFVELTQSKQKGSVPLNAV